MFQDPWKVISIAGIGAVLGILSMMLVALSLSWTGRLFGGSGSNADMRVAVAWSGLPAIIGLVISLLHQVIWQTPAGTPDGLFYAVGGIWSLVLLLAMVRRLQGFGVGRSLLSYGLAAFLILVVVSGFQIFVIAPFYSASKSMLPTFDAGDYFFVSKLPYRFSAPARGDLIVFRSPSDNKTDYVKRIVGLLGDHIQLIHRILYVNGKSVDRQPMDDYVDAGQAYRKIVETLPDGAEYRIIESQGGELPADNTPEYVVPSGHYFVLGDNRDNSLDSRFLAQIGYVPSANLIGKIVVALH